MTSYRLKRRHFALGLGGAWGGLSILRNLEAAACGAPAPARLLLVHWPGGTIPELFKPSQPGPEFTISPILQPFETAGLREDMVVLLGTYMAAAGPGYGGNAERGTVMMTTGSPCPAVRTGRGGDDPIAGGPSFDQIFLRHVPGLDRGRLLNVACDTRVDAGEISTRCLSYSYQTQDVEVSQPELGVAQEHVPLLPDTSPYEVYTRLFEGFTSGATRETLARRLLMKQSVLDSAGRELGRLQTLVAASERDKLEVHTEAIRQMERALSDTDPRFGACSLPPTPAPALVAWTERVGGGSTDTAEAPDTDRVQQLSDLFFQLIRTAFVCDLLRVATFQWCPATNHMAFAGLNPDRPDVAFKHHPYGSGAPSYDGTGGLMPAGHFLAGAHTWFNQRLADALVQLKTSVDVFGSPLLDATVIPFMTEKADMAHDRPDNVPSLILGGRGLGMQGGQYLELDNRPHNDVWMTVAQALFGEEDVMQRLAGEPFTQEGVAPIAGLWSLP